MSPENRTLIRRAEGGLVDRLDAVAASGKVVFTGAYLDDVLERLLNAARAEARLAGLPVATVPLRLDHRVIAWLHPDDADKLRSVCAGGVTFSATTDRNGALREISALPLRASPKDF